MAFFKKIQLIYLVTLLWTKTFTYLKPPWLKLLWAPIIYHPTKYFMNVHFFFIKHFCFFWGLTHGLRMPNEAFFQWSSEMLDLGRQIGQINSRSFGVFSAKLSAPILVHWVPCPCFLQFNHYFYKKPKPLYTNPNYLFWIWASNN